MFKSRANILVMQPCGLLKMFYHFNNLFSQVPCEYTLCVFIFTELC